MRDIVLLNLLKTKKWAAKSSILPPHENCSKFILKALLRRYS